MTQTLSSLMPGYKYTFNSYGRSWRQHMDGQVVMYVGQTNDAQAKVRFTDGTEWGTDPSFLAADVDGVVYPDHTEPTRLKTAEEAEWDNYSEVDHRAMAWMGKIVDVLNDNIGTYDAGHGLWSVKEVVLQFEGNTDTGFRIAISEFDDGLAVWVKTK